IIPAGRYMVYTCFNILPLFIIFEGRKRRRRLYGVAWLLLAVGIILTFNRNFWVGSIIIQMFVLLALDKARRTQLAKLYGVCILAMVVLGSIISLNPETKAAQAINSTVTRFTSLFESDTYNARFDDTANTSSLEWRRIENEVALPVVLRPTLLGLGMGAWYRDYMPVIDEGLEDQGFDRNVLRGYIHNSHFWIIMKAGWLSYVGLMGATAICVWRGFKHWHLVDRKYQPFVIGSSLSLIGLMLSAFVDPLLTDLTWSPVAGVIWGLNEAIFYLSEQQIEDNVVHDDMVNVSPV
ncbi:MAG: O-antigen ligase family protein, partial [Chloroflexota bacterium]